MLIPSSFSGRAFPTRLALLALVGILLYLGSGLSSVKSQLHGWHGLAKGSKAHVVDAADHAFWRELSQALVEADPGVVMPTGHIEALINSFSNLPNGFRPTPQSLVQLSEEEVQVMRAQHALFVERTASPHFPGLPYKRNTEGIVTSADNKLLPVLVVSLRMLRRSGSLLPVEVFLEDETRSPESERLCDEVLPALKARCVWMSSATSLMRLPQPIGRYQLKAFALLLSTFERLIWLDADNWPLYPPEELFTSEPFLSTGLITWPDYWALTASPHFFTIAGIADPLPLTSIAASESGSVLLSKARHARTLLLIAYYNYYGPSHFYTLLSQGAIGEGDKETFLAAAHALAAPFYAVHAGPAAVGYHSSESGFHGTATSQADPRVDVRVEKALASAGYDNAHRRFRKKDKKGDQERRDFFMHCQTLKTDPMLIVQKYRSEVRGRMWGPGHEQISRYGYDAELRLWEEIRWTACEMLGPVRIPLAEGNVGVRGGEAASRRDLDGRTAREGESGNGKGSISTSSNGETMKDEVSVFAQWRNESRAAICADVRGVMNLFFTP